MPWCFFQGTPFPSQLPHLCWVPWLIFLPFVLLWLQTQKDGLCRLARTLVWLFHICVSVGSPAVPCRRQRALTRLPGFCAKSHMYFIHSLVIAASPFCLLCLTQNKIIMTYTWFDTLKKLEQEDNVCKSFKPFWRKSLPELYLIPSLGVLYFSFFLSFFFQVEKKIFIINRNSFKTFHAFYIADYLHIFSPIGHYYSTS